MNTTLEERVAAGAAWLDEHEPGWERRIDLAVFLLEDACCCILGQVMPSRNYHLAVRQMHRRGEIEGSTWGVNHGFTLARYESAWWPDLEELWIALIKERFSTGSLSG